MDEIIRNLAPPLGGLGAAIIFYLWGAGCTGGPASGARRIRPSDPLRRDAD